MTEESEARIEVPYENLADMGDFAFAWMNTHRERSFEIAVLAMYCVAMKRNILTEIGYLDETFGIGWFEDDDYSNRVREAGYKVICTEESFVHHFGQASFKKLETVESRALWDRNQAYYERKWGNWVPHKHRVN